MNMEDDNTTTQEMNWRVLVSLIFARLATRPANILMSILLLDIAQSFTVPVGVMSQVRSTASMVSMVFGLFMGVISLRYKPKPLLLTGLILTIIAAAGCSMASTYTVMLLFFTLTGLGTSIVTPMSQALVGEYIDVDNRPRAFSYMLMSFTLVSAFVSGPILNQLALWGGWRLSFLGYVLPGAVIGLLFAFLGIPQSKYETITTKRDPPILESIKKILMNRSAVACIICVALGTASFTCVGVFGVSGFVERFGMPAEWRAPMWSWLTFMGALGSYLSGRLVPRIGRRPVSIIGVTVVGVCAVTFNNINAFWVAMAFITLCGIGWTVWYPASTSLTLEQTPHLRGSLMSLNNASVSLGQTLGIALGGYTLLNYGYGELGWILGAMGITASIIYQFFTHDPTLAHM